MELAKTSPTAAAREDDLELILRELGKALRLRLEVMIHEPVPKEMGLLLVRLAWAETLGAAAEKEPDDEDRSVLRGCLVELLTAMNPTAEVSR